MLDLRDYTTYKSYFEELASLHLQLRDFVHGEVDWLENEISNRKAPLLWLDDYQPVEIVDNTSDNILGRKRGALVIYDTPVDTKHEQIREKVQYTEGLVKQIMARMYQDNQAHKIVIDRTLFRYGRANDIKAATLYVGCRLEFGVYHPEDIAVDVNQWDDES